MPPVETLDVSVDQFVPTDFDPFTLSLPFSEMIASPGAIDWASLAEKKKDKKKGKKKALTNRWTIYRSSLIVTS